MKTIHRYLFFIGIAFTSTLVMPMTSYDYDTDLEDLDLFEPENIDPIFDSQDTKEFLSRMPLKNDSSCSPQDIISQLAESKITDLLGYHLYCATNPPNKRSVLDMPIFLPHSFGYPHKYAVHAALFWNQTSKKGLTRNGKTVNDYLNLKSPAIINLIDSLERVDFLSLDLSRVLTLFGTTHVQERQLGTALQLFLQQPAYTIRFMVPAYYFERNINIEPDELSEISALLGEASEGEQERFKKQHLISDKVGFGDLRMEINTPLVDHETFSLNAGGFVTMPTGFTIVKDIKGSSYLECTSRPNLDLVYLCHHKTLDNLTPFLFNALDYLSANLLQETMGNNRHVGLGICAQTRAAAASLIKRPWAEAFSFHARYSLEYLLPANEKRFYTLRPDPDALARLDKYSNEETIDPAVAESDLQFLEKTIVDWACPYMFTTRIDPGFVFWTNMKTRYERHHMGCTLGADFWVKGEEKLHSICDTNHQTTASEFRDILTKIEPEKARKPLAYQLKLFGGLSYHRTRKHHDWILAVHVDKTCKQAGIGNDFNFAVTFEISF